MLAARSARPSKPPRRPTIPTSRSASSPIRLPAAGPTRMLRIVGERLGAVLGQQIVVLNQPGAGGAVAARAGASATPDGYTLYMPAASAYRDARPDCSRACRCSCRGLQADRLHRRAADVPDRAAERLAPSTIDGIHCARRRNSPASCPMRATGRGTMTPPDRRTAEGAGRHRRAGRPLHRRRAAGARRCARRPAVDGDRRPGRARRPGRRAER